MKIAKIPNSILFVVFTFLFITVVQYGGNSLIAAIAPLSIALRDMVLYHNWRICADRRYEIKKVLWRKKEWKAIKG